MSRAASRRDLASGLLLIALGAFFAWSARDLAARNLAGQMGPGYFPIVLAGLLVLFGVVVIAASYFGTNYGAAADAGSAVPWRGIALLAAAIAFFGFFVRPLGLGPALAGAVLLSCLASRRWRPLPALLLTSAMVLFGWAVFIRGLGLPVAFLGTWLR